MTELVFLKENMKAMWVCRWVLSSYLCGSKKKVASFEKVTIKGPQFFSHDSKEMIDFVFGNHGSE